MKMRPKKSSKDLPPRMLRRSKKLKSGRVWNAYYYNGRDKDGNRTEIPLGTDLLEAKRRWAELEGKPVQKDFKKMSGIFDRYIQEALPKLSPRSQMNNLYSLKWLRLVFENMPIDQIMPQHIAQYRDHRTAKVSANREISLLSTIFNFAREWGYTAKENPARGVRRNKELPRDYFAEKDVWDAVYAEADEVLRDAMDVAYYSGQRMGDVLKMKLIDIRDGVL